MPDKKVKRPLKDTELDDKLFYNVVASTTESTGLIPTPPASDDASDSYSDIYDITQQQIDKDLTS
ncbi:MAG: hypothetical protein PHO66_00310 [Eubacteriales bacterium]|nr:hypothetical protein [Eubacteriales bacterium]